jgi:hypothetical protein
MPVTDPLSFTKMVPGFDFLQGLVKNAGAALPNVGHWIAPTLDPEELEKRIEELRTVQFWLEQNARMLGATIQALEVQRMTLSTLKTMNVSLGDLTESLKIRVPDPSASSDATSGAPAPAPRAASPRPAPEPAPEPEAAPETDDAPAAPTAPPGVIDPMQWWGALTKQFTDLAASAMNESATDAAKNLAGAMVKQSFDAAGETLKKAAAMPGNMVKTAASVAQKAASVAGTMAESAVGAAAKPTPRPAGKTAARTAGKTAATAARKAPAKKAAAKRAAR